MSITHPPSRLPVCEIATRDLDARAGDGLPRYYVVLPRNPLKGGVDLHSLPSRAVSLLEGTFALNAAEGADFAARFYRELFARYPSLSPLFARVSMRHQQQRLIAARGMVIDHLRSPDQSTPFLAELARRHVRYQVQASHCSAVTSVLLDVIRQSLGGAVDTGGPRSLARRARRHHHGDAPGASLGREPQRGMAATGSARGLEAHPQCGHREPARRR